MRVISPVPNVPQSTLNQFVEPAPAEWEGREFSPVDASPTPQQLQCLDSSTGPLTGQPYLATSSSSVAAGAGSKQFATQAGLGYAVGDRVRVSAASAYMEGLVTSYSGTTLVVNVDRVVGAGTLASWNIGVAGGRLIHPLRDAVRQQDAGGNPLGLENAVVLNGPTEILTRAAATFYLAAHPPAKAFSSLPPPSKETATALANLSVTGRGTYTLFCKAPPQDAALVPLVQARLAAGGVTAATADVQAAVKTALDRAYAVAGALRGAYPARVAARAPLGWIAVSGEDDPPHRPVNQASVNYTYHDITVTVPSHPNLPVATRFFIAPAPPPPVAKPVLSGSQVVGVLNPNAGKRVAPVDPEPAIPDGNRVILFLHGAGSNAEEVAALIKPLLDAGARLGSSFSIVSLDLPSTGYSTMLKHEDVAPLAATTYPTVTSSGLPIATPILQFIEDFVVAFVNELDTQTPVKSRFAGVIGGSLGGNLGLRLGERVVRQPADCAWLATGGIVSWSAASVWPPMVWILELFPDQSLAGASVAETAVSRAAASSIAGFTTPMIPPFPDLMPPLPSQWFGDSWPYKKAFLASAASGVGSESYNSHLRRWWPRVDCEQLVFSHMGRLEPSAPTQLAVSSTASQLLISGHDDNYPHPELLWGQVVDLVLKDLAAYILQKYGTDIAVVTANVGVLPFWDNLLFGLSGGTVPPGTLEAVIAFFANLFGIGVGAGDVALHKLPPIPRIYDNSIALAGLMSATPGRCLFLQATGHSVHDERPSYLAGEIARFLTHGAPTRPAACASANGSLDLFVVGADGSLRHKYQVVGTGGYVKPLAAAHVRWSDWVAVGGLAVSGSPALCLSGDKLTLMIVGTDGALHSMQQTTASGPGPNDDGVWSGWASHGGAFIGSPALGQHLGGALEVFVVGSDGALHNMRQAAPNAAWSAPTSLGGSFSATTPAVGRSGSSDVLEVMVVGKDGHLHHTWQIGAGWAPWYDHGGSFTGPAAIGRRGSDGALVVVVVGTDGQLYRKTQNAPNGGWSDWSALGGSLHGAPTLCTSGKLLEVMVVGTDGHLHHMWENSPGVWSPWFDHGGSFASSPILAQRAVGGSTAAPAGSAVDGALEVFCLGTDDWLWHKLQSAPNSGWGAWLSDVALYHLYLPGGLAADRHFYTTSQDERQQLLKSGWVDKAVAGYGLPAPAQGATPVPTPLFRWHKQLTNDHFYTTSPSDPGFGYVREGVVCYVYGSAADGANPLHAFYRSGIGALGQDHFYTVNDGTPGGYGPDTPPVACWVGSGLELP